MLNPIQSPSFLVQSFLITKKIFVFEPRHVPESTKVCPKPVKESLLPSRDIFFKETPWWKLRSVEWIVMDMDDE